MTDRRSTAVNVFDEPRQAIGWLTSRWAGPLIVLLVWATMIWERPPGAALDTWWPAASAVLLLGLGALNVWGYRVSSAARARLREATRGPEVYRWGRGRFGEEEAADRLGWATEPVIWTTRALMALAAAATVAAVAVLVLRWT